MTGKVGGVISFLFGPVRGCPRMGPQCLLTPPVSVSSIYAAVVCVGGLGSVCYIWSTSPVLSGVLSEFKHALSNSLFLSLSQRTWALGPCLRTTWHDDSLLSPVHLAVLLLQFQLFCLWLLLFDHAGPLWTFEHLGHVLLQSPPGTARRGLATPHSLVPL